MRQALILLAAAMAAQPAWDRAGARVHTAAPPSELLHRLDRWKIRPLHLTVIDPLAPGFDGPEPQAAIAAETARRGGGRIAQAAPLPKADELIRRWVQAMGGEQALAAIQTRAFTGEIFISTYGAYGQYEELGKAPDMYVRVFRFPGYAAFERGAGGGRAWEESPDYGVEALSGARLSEVRRQAVFHLPLEIRNVYRSFSVTGREMIDGQPVVAVKADTRDGAADTLWFDAATGLLLGIESTETFANGVRQRVRYLFEDYRPVDGVAVAHGVRYESPRLIWVVKRSVRHNVPLDESRFRPPDERR